MANESLVAVSGAVASVIAGVLAYFGTMRGKRVTDSSLLMEQMRGWATQVQLSEAQCRRDMEELREELDTVRDELDTVKRKLHQLEEQA